MLITSTFGVSTSLGNFVRDSKNIFIFRTEQASGYKAETYPLFKFVDLVVRVRFHVLIFSARANLSQLSFAKHDEGVLAEIDAQNIGATQQKQTCLVSQEK